MDKYAVLKTPRPITLNYKCAIWHFNTMLKSKQKIIAIKLLLLEFYC